VIKQFIRRYSWSSANPFAFYRNINHSSCYVEDDIDTKALTEVKALELFYQILMSDPDKAFHGVKGMKGSA